jgi:hypothetical protein
MPLVAIGNYLLFFTPTLVSLVRRFVQRGARVGEGRRFRDDGGVGARVRKCALCGVTDEDRSVDIRVCSCAKCGKPTEYCLAHARDH